MKYINKIIVSLCILLFCTACGESFFEKNPVGYISEGSYWTSERDVKAWMSGTYAGIQTVMSAGYTLWGEGRSDNFYPTIYDNADFWQLNGLTSNISQTDWTNLYVVINRCNLAIAKLPGMTTIAEPNKSYYDGQFRTIRALMYFYAIRLWGDVPLITESWNGDRATLYHERTPVSDVKQQIESDLQAASDELDLKVDVILPDTFSRCYYINKASAMAVKMGVNMWFKEYQNALDASDYIIQTKRYSLVTTPTQWKNIFLDPASSTETMLTLNWIPTPQNQSNSYGARLCSSDKSPTFGVSREVFTVLLRDKNDIRLWGVLDTLSIYNDAGKFPLTPEAIVVPGMYGSTNVTARGAKLVKFCPYTLSGTTLSFTIPTQSLCFFKLPVIRYADVLLMRAEVLNKLGRGQEALDIVNQIRKRCGNNLVADIAYYNEERGVGDHSRERCILEERQAEFYGEGNRWFDLLRADDTADGSSPIFNYYMDSHMKDLQSIKGMTLDGFGDPRKKLFPIYFQAFINNPLLEGHQNPPYSE